MSEESEESTEEKEDPSTTREKLEELGFYDNEFTEFPPELSAVKSFKAENNPDPLIEALQLDGFDVDFMREEMIEALGWIGDEKAVDILEEILDDSDMRPYAIEALGRIESSGSIDKISKYLGSEARVEPHVRVKSAEALGKIGSVDGLSILLEALEDDSSQVRSTAVKSIGQILKKNNENLGNSEIDENEIIEKLDRILKNEKESIRVSAAKTLKQMNEGKAKEVLEKYKDDPNELVATSYIE